MVQQVWDKKEDYYDKTQWANEALLAGPHYQYVLPFLQKAKKILEVGCGDGGVLKTLSTILSKQTKFFGVDISSLAIKRARTNVPIGTFDVADGNTLPFKDTFFDCTCSFFTFEHVIDPDVILSEMSRVTKSNGMICIICPNYGSPIYPSPCATDSIPRRILGSFFGRKQRILQGNFGWRHVTPIADTTDIHVPDHDTLIEPDLSLFLDAIDSGSLPKLELVAATSMWETITPKTSLALFCASVPLRLLAVFFTRPFAYWGPLFVVVLRKK